jgi:hypothetical protein
MQNDRQAMLARQLELLTVKEFLALAQRAQLELRDKKIKPDFPDRQQAWVIPVAQQRSVQLGQVGLSGTPDKQRMNAQRVAVATSVRQASRVLKMRHGHRWNHTETNARLLGAFAHGPHICSKLGRVQVTVGVDP